MLLESSTLSEVQDAQNVQDALKQADWGLRLRTPAYERSLQEVRVSLRSQCGTGSFLASNSRASVSFSYNNYGVVFSAAAFCGGNGLLLCRMHRMYRTHGRGPTGG